MLANGQIQLNAGGRGGKEEEWALKFSVLQFVSRKSQRSKDKFSETHLLLLK